MDGFRRLVRNPSFRLRSSGHGASSIGSIARAAERGEGHMERSQRQPQQVEPSADAQRGPRASQFREASARPNAEIDPSTTPTRRSHRLRLAPRRCCSADAVAKHDGSGRPGSAGQSGALTAEKAPEGHDTYSTHGMAHFDSRSALPARQARRGGGRRHEAGSAATGDDARSVRAGMREETHPATRQLAALSSSATALDVSRTNHPASAWCATSQFRTQ